MVVSEARTLLFVYGSLKRGHASHGELRGARFVMEACTSRHFSLREIDGFPALVPGARAIIGELFEVEPELLPALDTFEGEGYRRQEIELADGTRAITYLARSPTGGTAMALDEWHASRR